MTRLRFSGSISARASRGGLAAAALALLLAGPVAAMEAAKPAAGAARMAIIDVQRILQESLAARSVQKQLETQRAKFQAEISGREKQLHDADSALKELRGKAASGADPEGGDGGIDAREQQLRQRFMERERDVQTKRHALDEGFTVSMGIVRTNLLDVVQDVARGQGLQVVLLKQQALWYDAKLDITDEVLARLNTRLTHVPVKIDLAAPAKALTPESGDAKGKN